MNVGLYFDLRNPPAWATDFGRLYGFTLETCEEAERLGAIRSGSPSTTASTTITFARR